MLLCFCLKVVVVIVVLLVTLLCFPHAIQTDVEGGLVENAEKKKCRKENVEQESNRNIFDSTLSFRYFPFRHFSFRRFPPHPSKV